MTLAQVKTMLEAINGYNDKVVYRAWPIGQAPALPFICFMFENNDNFLADDLVYFSKKMIRIEHYSEFKDETAEAAIEAALDAKNLIWTKEETYIDDQSMLMIIYNLEV